MSLIIRSSGMHCRQAALRSSSSSSALSGVASRNKIPGTTLSCCNKSRRGLADETASSLSIKGRGGRRANSSSSSSSSAQNRSYDYYRKKREGSFSFSWFTRLRNSNNIRKAPVTTEERNVQVAWYMTAIVVGALGATYASVPLYKVFCQATGFGGTTQRVNFDGQQQEETMIENLFRSFIQYVSPKQSSGVRVHTWTDEDAAQRLATLKPVKDANLVTIRFDTTVNDIMPWTFTPVTLDVKVVPGETALSFFRVKNRSDKAITGVATYNVYPPKMGLYFQKIQCFCFEEQRLLPGETVDMPVFFFIDPDMLDDPQVSYVTDVTLSYTFFQTDEDDDDDDDDDDNDDDDKN
jgi:cytochrome c oxidase assembly protein subunit 11